MHSMKRYANRCLALAALLIGLSACEEVVDLDLPQGETRLVVEGRITDQPGVNEVKLSTTLPYFDSNADPAVSNATVLLSDDQGRLDTLKENPAGSGRYPIETPGQIGYTYVIDILTPEGKRYRSEPERLMAVAAIDSIYYRLDPATDPDEEDEYDVLLNARETPGEPNFYRWRIAVNGVYRQKPFDLFYANDDFLDGNDVIGFQVNFDPVFAGDSIRVDQWSISEAYFDYLDLVWQQTAIIGGIFDPPPAPIKGNIYSPDDRTIPAYGFFNASAIRSIAGVVE